MGAPRLDWHQVPLAREMDTLALPLPGSPVAVGMGNPHCVSFVDDVAAIDLSRVGPELEHDPLVPERTNVEFAEVRAEHWASFAKENGLAPAIVRDRIGHLAAVLPTRARELAASDPVFAASAIVTEICARITDRCNNVSH